ncbi:MAG: bifunctional nuclease family protein [Actinomycetes bacterium]
MTDESASTESIEPQSKDAAEVLETFRVMNVVSVTYLLPEPHPEVNLQEAESPYRTVAVMVALNDAQSIAMALDGVTNTRPNTHELFVNALRGLTVDIIAVRIVKYEQGVYYAELDLMSPRGQVVVQCRLTDGIALALRQTVPAPLLCAESILQSQY